MDFRRIPVTDANNSLPWKNAIKSGQLRVLVAEGQVDEVTT